MNIENELQDKRDSIDDFLQEEAEKRQIEKENQNKLIFNLPASEYNALKGIRSTALKRMLKTPLDYKMGSDETDSKALTFGTAVHTFILEPEKFDSIYTSYFGDGRSAEAKAFKAANADKTILGKADVEVLARIRKAIKQNENFKSILASGKAEVTGICKDFETGLDLKARADIYTPETIWDVKTDANGMSDKEIFRTILRYNYHFSAAHYMRVFSQASPIPPKNFGWIFIDKVSPACHIRILMCPPDLLKLGENLVAQALGELASCEYHDDWRGYSQEIEELEMPDWFIAKQTEIDWNPENV
jgi:hypothetical protein